MARARHFVKTRFASLILKTALFLFVALIVPGTITTVARPLRTNQPSITNPTAPVLSSSQRLGPRYKMADRPEATSIRPLRSARQVGPEISANGPVFLPSVNYSVAGNGSPTGFTIADVNGDGKPDLLVATSGGENLAGVISDGTVAVLLGNGDGTFGSAVNYDSGGVWTYAVVTADVNGDGKLDLVTLSGCATGTAGFTCSPHGVIGVLFGNGDGTFQPVTVYDSGGSPGDSFNGTQLAVADVNKDKKPDIMVANFCETSDCTSGSVSVLLGNANGTFQPAVNYASGGIGAGAVVTADVNGDGVLDLVVANCGSTASCNVTPPPDGSVGVLLGNGDGTFQTAVTYDAGSQTTTAVAVADVNGDGKPDLVTSNCGPYGCTPEPPTGSGGQVVGVLLNNGDGTFRSAVSYDAAISPDSVVISDVNMDGKPDIVVGNWGSSVGGSDNAGSFSVLPGNGDGTFQPAVSFLVYSFDEVVTIAVADVNGDGKPDVVTTNINSGVFVSLNNAGPQSETTTTVSVIPSQSFYGQFVNLTATVTSNSVAPTGTVEFYDGSVLLGSSLVSNSTATLNVQSLTLGSHSITAAYQGSQMLEGSTSPPVTWTVSSTTSSTTLSSSANPVARGRPITLTALVLSRYGGPVTGSVVFTNGAQKLGTVVLSGPYVSLVTSFAVDGSNSIVATYSGDSNSAGSSSAPLTQYVDSDTSKTAVTTSGSPSMVGQPVIFTAKVTSTYGAIPNGEIVTFLNGISVIGTASLTDGVVTLTTSSLSGGTHAIKVTYPGDSTFLPSASTVKQVVDLYPTSLTLGSSLNPSNSGQSVTFTATVTSSGPDTPTGSVKFVDGTKTLSTVKVVGGVAALTRSNLSVGTHSITAFYGGDSQSLKSTSPVLSQIVN